MTDINHRLGAKARAAQLKSKPLATLKSVAELIVAKAKEKQLKSTTIEVEGSTDMGIWQDGGTVTKADVEAMIGQLERDNKHGGSRKGAGRPADPSVQLKYRIKKEIAMEVDAAIRELLSSKYGIVPKKIATKNSSD